MSEQNNDEKLKKLTVIKQLMKENNVSVAEMHKKTLLDKGGIWKILNGTTKNPQITTIDRMYYFLVNTYISPDVDTKFCIINGVKINYIDIALEVANNEQEFMKFKIIANIIDKRVAMKLISVTHSKKHLIDFIKGKHAQIVSNNDS